MINNILFLISFLLMFLFSSSKKIFATEYFLDNFDQKNSIDWNYIQKEEDISYFDGVLNLDAGETSGFYPLIINNKNIFPDSDKDWSLKINFKYRSTGCFGDGIGIGFTNSNGNLFYQFGVWNDSQNYLFFYYNDFNKQQGCSNFELTNDLDGRSYVHNLPFENGKWYVFQIDKEGSLYKVYIDKDINNRPIYVTNDNQCLPKNLWFGNKLYGGNGSWSMLSVDYLYVGDNIFPNPTPTLIPTLVPTEMPTPTLTPIPTFIPTSIPTQTPTPKNKIIFLPGLGASWNSEAIVYNKKVSSNDWKMTPFVKNYDALIKALEDNGLKRNEDFYVWNYDWRKSVKDISNDLNAFIDENIESGKKVDLIGHSLGGVVARIWAEDNVNNDKLGKVITLSSPHLGSLETYEIWNGGEISDLSKISSIAFKILIKLQGLKYKTDAEAIRNYSPIVKDLLPTFDYVKKNGNVVSNNNLTVKNDFLINQNLKNIDLNLETINGNEYKTKEWIGLKKNNIFDKILGIWPDGRIDNYLYSYDGDGTVLTKSSNFKLENYFEIDSNHGDIIDKSIEKVLSDLNLNEDIIINNNDSTLDNYLVFFIGSPAILSVSCDGKEPILENDGFVMIKNESYKSCEIKMIATDSGLVHLVLGNTNNNNWSYFENEVVKDEEDKIIIDPNNGELINNLKNIEFIKQIILDDLNKLLIKYPKDNNLKQAISFTKMNQSALVLNKVFDFRRNKNENLSTEKIIENLVLWNSFSNKCSKNIVINDHKLNVKYKNFLEKLTIFAKNKNYFNENTALNFESMNKYLNNSKEMIDSKNYNFACSANLAAKYYGLEIVRRFNINYLF